MSRVFGALYVKNFWCPFYQEFLVPLGSRVFRARFMFGSLYWKDQMQENGEKEAMIFIGPTNREAAIEASSKSAVASGA